MIRLDSDRVHWLLVVSLVALSLQLALQFSNSVERQQVASPGVKSSENFESDIPRVDVPIRFVVAVPATAQE